MKNMREIKNVTLVGLGAMGSFFAPRLYEALGEHFRVLAGGERKKRLETRGVTINGKQYLFPIVTPEEESESADLIILSVKDTGLEQAIQDIRHQVGEHTVILPVLNGIESEKKVAAVYGWDHVLYAFMRVSIVMQDGCANFDPQSRSVHFGEKINRMYSERVYAVKQLLERCHIPYEIDEDMEHGMWFKFMANVGENMTCALLGIPFGGFRVCEHANVIRRAAMKEVVEIANRLGIAIGQKEMDVQEAVIQKIKYENKPSTLQDLENGRKTEVEMFSGTVVRLGQQLQVSTPVNLLLYHGIKALEQKAEILAQNISN